MSGRGIPFEHIRECPELQGRKGSVERRVKEMAATKEAQMLEVIERWRSWWSTNRSNCDGVYVALVQAKKETEGFILSQSKPEQRSRRQLALEKLELARRIIERTLSLYQHGEDREAEDHLNSSRRQIEEAWLLLMNDAIAKEFDKETPCAMRP
jgi:hypothetical protein